MFLYLGEGKYKRLSSLIGIFDMDSATVCVATRRFLAEKEKEGNVESDGELPKSFLLYEKENEDLISRITESARNSLIRNLAKGIDDIEVLRSKLRDDVAEYARKRTKHRPMIVVMLSDIQQ